MTGNDIVSEWNADLILVDIGMTNGIAASRQVREIYPEIKILLITADADQKNIREILKIGVEGYILKDSVKARLVEAIGTITQGQIYCDPGITAIMQRFYPKKNATAVNTSLTEREKEIVRLISAGKSTAEIATALFLSLLTIETHRKNIYTKLGFNKIANLVRYALAEGLLD